MIADESAQIQKRRLEIYGQQARWPNVTPEKYTPTPHPNDPKPDQQQYHYGWPYGVYVGP